MLEKWALSKYIKDTHHRITLSISKVLLEITPQDDFDEAIRKLCKKGNVDYDRLLIKPKYILGIQHIYCDFPNASTSLSTIKGKNLDLDINNDYSVHLSYAKFVSWGGFISFNKFVKTIWKKDKRHTYPTIFGWDIVVSERDYPNYSDALNITAKTNRSNLYDIPSSKLLEVGLEI